MKLRAYLLLMLSLVLYSFQTPKVTFVEKLFTKTKAKETTKVMVSQVIGMYKKQYLTYLK